MYFCTNRVGTLDGAAARYGSDAIGVMNRPPGGVRRGGRPPPSAAVPQSERSRNYSGPLLAGMPTLLVGDRVSAETGVP